MIKALTYEQMNEVESHFLNMKEERARVQELTADIAESASYAIDPTGVHGSKTSDMTADKAAQVERETRVLKAWGDVVKETFNHFKSDPLMLNLFCLLYVSKMGYQEILERMYIGQTSLYEYRKEILRYGALRAVAHGLMEV